MSITAGAGVEQLREQLAELERALESYADPVVAEHQGLRLMHEVLEERAAHIRDTIADAETTALTLTVMGEAAEEGGLPAELGAGLLTACQAAAAALADDAEAAVLHLRGVEGVEGGVALRLSRRPGLLQAQPTDGEGRLLVDLALRRLVLALAGDREVRDDAAAGGAAARLASALAGAPVTLRASLRSPTAGEAEARCDAERLAALRG